MTKSEAAGKLHYLLCMLGGFVTKDIADALRIAIKVLDPGRNIGNAEVYVEQ